MSDQPLSDDELASAMLDGEATGPRPADAAVAARVDELRLAADAIAQPVIVDDAISRAGHRGGPAGIRRRDAGDSDRG